jgi:hypothetical protein
LAGGHDQLSESEFGYHARRARKTKTGLLA